MQSGTFSALSVSFENSSQILELSTPSCSMTPLLIDYGLEASNPYDISLASNVDKLAGRLRTMRPSIVLYNLLGPWCRQEEHALGVAHSISSELHDYIKDTGFILVTLGSMTVPVLNKATKN